MVAARSLEKYMRLHGAMGETLGMVGGRMGVGERGWGSSMGRRAQWAWRATATVMQCSVVACSACTGLYAHSTPVAALEMALLRDGGARET